MCHGYLMRMTTTLASFGFETPHYPFQSFRSVLYLLSAFDPQCICQDKPEATVIDLVELYTALQEAGVNCKGFTWPWRQYSFTCTLFPSILGSPKFTGLSYFQGHPQNVCVPLICLYRPHKCGAQKRIRSDSVSYLVNRKIWGVSFLRVSSSSVDGSQRGWFP